MDLMSAKNSLKSVSKWQFFVGLGEGILSGILAGLVIWYYFEHDNLNTIISNHVLLVAVSLILFFPVYNLVRKDWRLFVTNITGLFLLITHGIVYMVFVWLIISRGEMP